MFGFKKRSSKQIDTSRKGFEYVGINLTEKQYEDLKTLNAMILMDEHRQNIPVFNTMLVLKILGLLPSEMVRNVSNSNSDDNTNNDFNNYLERKFGKVMD
jgi:hypothetical protein